MILLADSQLLFPGKHSQAFLAVLGSWLAGKRGIYLGAANGNVQEFFALAEAAVSALGAKLEWQSSAVDTLAPDYDFYLLAGGDVAEGWRYLSQPGVHGALQRAYQAGALFIGVSAGALHLAYVLEAPDPQPRPCLGWMKAVIAVHEESEAWPTKLLWQGTASEHLPLICIPMGGAYIWHHNQGYQSGKGAQYSQDQHHRPSAELLTLTPENIRER